MNLYVKIYDEGKNKIVVKPKYLYDLSKVDHRKNGKALLAFLIERVPRQTLSYFAGRLKQPIPEWELGKSIEKAYNKTWPEPMEPKFTNVSIDPDLLKVIKTHCPQTIKE